MNRHAELDNNRLAFLDGLRGLAAVFVVAHHLHQELSWGAGPLSPRIQAVTKWLQLGHYAVDVFIVLSGFSLMIPVAKSGMLVLPGGIRRYVVRRARRILPPYYAAAAVTLLLICLIPGLRRSDDPRWASSLPAFRTDVIISHLLLVHNWNPNWINKINAPFWSVATEWQIYFFFPLFLLPLWKRAGVIPMLVLVSAAAATISYLLPSLDGACPWFLILFAFGMVSSWITFSPSNAAISLRRTPIWTIVFLILAASLATAIKLIPYRVELTDLICGMMTASLLVALETASRGRQGIMTFIKTLLESPPLVAAGAVSYSLYLIHSPFITIAALLANRMGIVNSSRRIAGISCIAAILVGIATYCFYKLFEYPFIAGRPTVTSALPSTSFEPAI